MYDDYWGPSELIKRAGSNPLDLFFFFLPKSFWRHVAQQSNLYWRQTLDAKVEKAYLSQSVDESGRRPQSKERIRFKLEKFKKVLPHELLQWVGLLVARVLSPKKHIADHWSKAERGVFPSGTFGSVIPRDRFKEISRFLHFADNSSSQAAHDRAWKIRPVLSTMEQTFMAGYFFGRHIAIDEGMLPSRNRHNPTRTYLKDKPHEWGSRCVMTCCASTGYCKRLELDVCKKNHFASFTSVDTKSGPAAVIRNLSIIFDAQQLRTLGFHFCGTIQKNRLGWCKNVEFSFKKRPQRVPRGTFKMAPSKKDPGLVALGWVDNKPVYFLASHVSTDLTTRFQKYYHSLFLGLLDVVIVNAYISQCWVLKGKRRKKNSHYDFLSKLHAALIALTEDVFTNTRQLPRAAEQAHAAVSVSEEHELVQVTDKRQNNGMWRLRSHNCRVCTIMAK
ncbi:hypothetical protein PC129_g11375 [Phytophthora cactorum]|uniref:PiggyBac transposable element-derived protein domain-containing protein n=1 Tax=Phytophthora cactorum TaxID=29920 RepID=A0A8T1I091_9STRA|nr:hypothetical protein PC119_g13915 [Phytophthora cactorum]KAG3217801.1 hypothetical protein PC129_g11375 [Phytophthora cactorum]